MEYTELKGLLKSGRHVHIKYRGQGRTLFYNSDRQLYGILWPRSKKRGVVFDDWDGIESWTDPRKRDVKNVTEKFIREARKASFSNPFVRDCLKADPSKGPYENGLSTGVSIEGQLVSLERIDKMRPGFLDEWKECWEEKRNRIWRFDFCGYDGSVELMWAEDGEPKGWLSKEYRDCGNGYYYLLVNDKYFIGYDID